MPKVSALPEDVLPTLDDFTYTLDSTSSTAEKTKWSNVLKMLLGGIYPVGCVYTETIGVNPNTTLGFGTWTAFGSGRVIVGQNSGDTEFATNGQTGGEKYHQLTVGELASHAHGVSDPGHRHLTCDAGQTVFTAGSTNHTSGDGAYQQISWGSTNTGYSGTGIGIYGTGSDQAHNNLQPYIVAYFWKRTA